MEPSEEKTDEEKTDTVDDSDAGTTSSGDDPGDVVEGSSDETDLETLAQLIAQEIAKTQPTYETLEIEVGGNEVELRIVDTMTRGDILVSLLLTLAIGVFLLRWFFSSVWGR